jgi:hypothetical protein
MPKRETRTIDLGKLGEVTVSFELVSWREYTTRFPHSDVGCMTSPREFLQSDSGMLHFINPYTHRYENIPVAKLMEAFGDADLNKPYFSFSCDWNPHRDAPNLTPKAVAEAMRAIGAPEANIQELLDLHHELFDSDEQ